MSLSRLLAGVGAGLILLGGLIDCRNNRPQPEASKPQEQTATKPTSSTPDAPAGLSVLIAYGSEKKSWLEEQITAFNGAKPKLPSGAPFSIVGKAMGSGEAMQDILDGRMKPAVFSPASGAYVTLLNDAWLARPGQTKPIAPAGDSVVISPIVLAIWKPMAEALGWPKKSIAWSDILKISQNPQGWQSLGRAEWGQFKLGHTHPEYSNSGLLAVLAEAYAGAGKSRELTLADLEQKKTQVFLEGIEKAVVHYGKSTGFFSDKMLARGPSYLSAAVLYENSVVESYSHPAASGMPLVAVYPREGTFWSDHPYSVLDADWVTPEQRKGAELFLAHLKSRPAQERALALGFRPGDPAVAVSNPIDAEHGCDPKQPQTLLSVPNAAVLKRLLELFQQLKKPSDVTLIFDKSGSMQGQPLTNAKAGARAFLEALHERDQASVLFFDNVTYPMVGPLPVKSGRGELVRRVTEVIANGGTALYEAVANAYREMKTRAESDRSRIYAIVVMTDGKDESSKLQLSELKAMFPRESEEAKVKLFTIAYGAQATADVLSEIAEAGDGSHSVGTTQNIVQVYRDIASFF